MHPANNPFNRPLWQNGPQPGAFYNFPGPAASSVSANNTIEFGTQRTSQPITTGTSVIGVKFDGGVVLAADTLVSYGSLASFRDVDRVFKVNDHCIIGAGQDFADFQFIKRYINEKVTEDFCHDDQIELKPRSLYNWLTRLMYNRRSRMDPLWVDLVVGGIQDGEPFLGHVDLRGRAYEDKVIATGYGKHLAVPLLREYSENPNVTLDLPGALQLIKNSMEVLFYRDCRGYSQYKQVVCTTDGVRIDGPINVKQEWNFAHDVTEY